MQSFGWTYVANRLVGRDLSSEEGSVSFARGLIAVCMLNIVIAVMVNYLVYFMFLKSGQPGTIIELLIVPAFAALVVSVPLLWVEYLLVRGMLEQSARLRKEADTDYLTNILSRRAFERKVKESLQHNSGAFLLLDLDRFKALNDANGHEYGDKVLVHVGAGLFDIAPGALSGRLGGDEFAVFIPGCRQEDQVKYANMIRQSISEVTIVAPENSGVIRVTSSVGAVWADTCDNYEELYRAADAALYEAKAAGRNRLEIYDPIVTI